jgi:hypothetical protein
VQVVGLPRFRRRWRLRVGGGRAREELAAVGSGNRHIRQISSHPALFFIEKRALKPKAT